MFNFNTVVCWARTVSQRLTFSSIKYWEKRARIYDRASVMNLNHPIAEYEHVTNRQKEILLPIFSSQLHGHEKQLLDFGCGPGRFTTELARIINGKALGVDPIQYLLDRAPKSCEVRYEKITGKTILTSDQKFDVIWICLVMGGIISDIQLKRTLKMFDRVSNDDCLLFLIENTSDKQSSITWKYRSAEKYKKLFINFNLEHLKDYDDLGERISILSGRKSIFNVKNF